MEYLYDSYEERHPCKTRDVTAIDHGVGYRGGSWLVCEEHSEIVFQWMQLDEDNVRWGEWGDDDEPCSWEAHMTAEQLVLEKADRAEQQRKHAQKAAAKFEKQTAKWIGKSMSGAPTVDGLDALEPSQLRDFIIWCINDGRDTIAK